MDWTGACCCRHWPDRPPAHGSTSNAPCIWDRYGGCWPTGSASKLSEYGRDSDPRGGGVAVPLPCPVVVVSEYTYPGCSVREKLPLTGVMSCECTNQVAGSLELTFVV